MHNKHIIFDLHIECNRIVHARTTIEIKMCKNSDNESYTLFCTR